MPSWIDFHTHILDAPRDAITAAAHASKSLHIDSWLVNSVDAQNWESHQRIAKDFPLAVTGLGWHPEQVMDVSEKQIHAQFNWYEKEFPRAAFIGETGLDFLYGKTPAQRARQELSFTFFIRQSLAHQKLLEVHTRHAKQESIDLLLKHEARDVLLHWFSGNKSQIKTIEEQQWVCSVGPTILNSPHVDKFIQSMPLELLALETDSPIPYDDTPSDPSWIPRVAEKVAKLKGVELKDVAKAQQRVFKRFFD